MDNQYPYTTSPEERAARRAERVAARRERERRQRRDLLLRLLPAMALGVLVIGVAIWTLATQQTPPAEPADNQQELNVPVEPSEPDPPVPTEVEEPEETIPPIPTANADTVTMGTELVSEYAVIIDLDTNAILAQKRPRTVISPASMTKILTLLVACEHITDESMLDDTITIDLNITNYTYANECSVAGFEIGEAVPVRELLYGTILPSGGEAALGLARYVAGGHDAFVEKMNEKAVELGISATARFSNCVGLYDENNVCTVYDMALILMAALENELAREVLTTKVREIPANAYHSEGMVLSNWFLRKIEDHVPDGIEVVGAKTGFVDEAGNCAASYAETSDGGRYICVTGDSTSSWQCIRDHVQLYETYALQ